MFALDQVTVMRAGRPILDGVTLELGPGALTVVIGPNGAGKTTLVRVLSGDIAPDTGSIAFQGRPLQRWSEPELASRRAILPQTSYLSFPFTVLEVAALGALSVRVGGPAQRRLALESLARVGIADYAGRYYQTLSGGEQQRVHLARVLCQVPVARDAAGAHWLLLDEPTSNLDVRHQFAILGIAQTHARAAGGVLAVLHDLNMAALYADRLIVMANGGVVADGEPASVLTDRLLKDVFGVPLCVNVTPAGGQPFVLPHSALPVLGMRAGKRQIVRERA